MMWVLSCLAAVAVLMLYYYFKHVVHAPRIIFKPTKRNLALRAALSDHLEEFRPLWYGFNTHVQTIVNVTLRTSAKVEYQREEVVLRRSDGGRTALDWAAGNNDGRSPVCMVLTGYTGSSEELEIKILVRQLIEDGFEGGAV